MHIGELKEQFMNSEYIISIFLIVIVFTSNLIPNDDNYKFVKQHLKRSKNIDELMQSFNEELIKMGQYYTKEYLHRNIKLEWTLEMSKSDYKNATHVTFVIEILKNLN